MEPTVSDSTTNPKSLQVAFLLDITGSMSSQIEGMKQMISKFCEVERALVEIHIWTFTETSSECYVTKSPRGMTAAELVNYANTIVLSQPRGHPGVSASGGDGPENVVAATALLIREFTSDDNLLCFIITDDSPHHKAFGESGEAKAEKKWLKDNGFDNTDVYYILNEAVDSLNATFVPVLYGSAQTAKWYQQAAFMTGGLVLCPASNDSQVLATGLGTLLDTFQQLSVHRNVQLASNIDTEKLSKGFSLLVIEEENFECLEMDPDTAAKTTNTCKKTEKVEDMESKLFGLMKTTVDRFSGKVSSKRCRSVDVTQITSSVKILVLAMLYSIDSKLQSRDRLDAAAAELLTYLDTQPDDSMIKWEAKPLRIFLTEVDKVKSRLVGWVKEIDDINQPVKCEDSLMSALDRLNTLSTVPKSESEVADWMKIILELCMCRLIEVKYPIDASGKPDFQDAWASSINAIDFSFVLSAMSAMESRDLTTGIYKSKDTSHAYNAALILAHPNDQVLTEIYTTLSSLVTLQGLLQSYLVSGSFKVFPTISFGLQASCLWHIIRTQHNKPFSQAQWEFVRCVIWSIQKSSQTPGFNIYNQLVGNQGLNPVDNISKIIAANICYFYRNYASKEQITTNLRFFLEELSADLVMFYNKQAARAEHHESALLSDADIVAEVFKFGELGEFDPLSGLHDSEKIVKNLAKLPEGYFSTIAAKVATTKGFTNFKEIFKLFCILLQCDLKNKIVEEAFTDIYVEFKYDELFSDKELVDIFTESLLIKRRTARYVLEPGTTDWKRVNLERISADVLEKSLLELTKENLATQFGQWTTKRKEYGYQKLKLRVKELNFSNTTEYEAALTDMKETVVDVNVVFSRMDAIEALENIDLADQERLKTLGVALCLGGWSKEPPCQLRRSYQIISSKFNGLPEIQERIKENILKEPVCARPPDKPNRNGHHINNIYPGILGWSQEYENEVLKKKKVLTNHLKKMKEYTLYSKVVYEELSNCESIGNKQKWMIKWAIEFPKDPSMIDQIKGFIESIKNKKAIEEMEATDKIIKTLTTTRHPLKHLKGFLESIEV